ncbi:hypothetical protein DFJ73DRAFT_896207 [Zopfochytrium polystomum]|nr:hypothetical protein DFJ73DRAFT_896207 [Zopfochytrium polystomum]
MPLNLFARRCLNLHPSAPGQKFFDSLRISAKKAERVSIQHRRSQWKSLRKLAYEKFLSNRRGQCLSQQDFVTDEGANRFPPPQCNSSPQRSPSWRAAGSATPETPVLGHWSFPASPPLSPSGSFFFQTHSIPSPNGSITSSASSFSTATTFFDQPVPTFVPSLGRFSQLNANKFQRPRTAAGKLVRGIEFYESTPPAVFFFGSQSNEFYLNSAETALEALARRKTKLHLAPLDHQAVRAAKVRRFLQGTAERHQQRVYENRGIAIPLNDRQPWNLALSLHITDKYCRDFDVDADQTAPAAHAADSSPIQWVGGERVPVTFVSVRGEAEATESQWTPLYDAADALVTKQFAKKKVTADLAGVVDDGFTADIVRDAVTGVVLGTAQYVYMRRYLWLDALAVKEEAQGLGIGSLLLQRLIENAAARGKQVLCFALKDVVTWYERHGFRHCPEELPEKPWHIGKFLVQGETPTLAPSF